MRMKKTVAVLGTFDTKGQEFQYLMECLRDFQISVVTIDVGTGDPVSVVPDYRAAESPACRCTKRPPKEEWMEMLAREAASYLEKLIGRREVDGVISMGGGQGTFLANRVFRTLPVGMPKVLMSTLALLKDSAEQFLGLNDTMVINSLVDIAGLNKILKMNIRKAAAAMAGMAGCGPQTAEGSDRPAVGISCWGVTTPCVEAVRRVLERHGYEVYIFHANGEGGAMLERFARDGLLKGVADITLSEVTMPLAGSYQDAVPERLTCAGKAGIPQVVVPGGVDMVLRHKEELSALSKRKVYRHTPEVVFVRSSKEENVRFAKVIAEKLNRASGDITVLIPQKGLSMADRPGGPLYEPETDRVLFKTLKDQLLPQIKVLEMDCHITDTRFGETAAEILIEKMKEEEKKNDR